MSLPCLNTARKESCRSFFAVTESPVSCAGARTLYMLSSWPSGFRPSTSEAVELGVIFLIFYPSPLPVAKPYWVLPIQDQSQRALVKMGETLRFCFVLFLEEREAGLDELALHFLRHEVEIAV